MGKMTAPQSDNVELRRQHDVVMMPRKFIIAGRVQAAPFLPKKWMFFRYVYRDVDGTLYTKQDYPPPPVVKPKTAIAISLIEKWQTERCFRAKAEADIAALKAAGRFAVGVMDAFWSPPDVGSLDGFDLQELAEKHGMLTRFDVPEGGCGEACNCICEGAEPGDDCYRWSETFKRVRTGVEE